MPVPPCGSYGDIDRDGDVTTVDVMMVSQYLDGSRTLTSNQLLMADVDGDGKVTSNDALLISKYSVGSITTFPICSKTKLQTFVVPIGATLKVDGVEVI